MTDSEQGDFRLESEAFEPDSDVVDLVGCLIDSEEVIAAALSEDDRSYVCTHIRRLPG